MMDMCESEIFIEIPSPYYDPNARDLDDYTQDFANVGEIFKALNPYKGNVEACAPSTYVLASETVGMVNIIGNDENNHLPIQQNERRFYEALKRYIYKSLELYLNKEGMFSEAELESRIKNNVLPVHIRVVLESFVKAFVNVNWRHSSLVPANEFKPDAEVGDDDDDSDRMSDSADLKSEYDSSHIDFNRANLDNLATKLNHYLVAIEQLMKSNLTAYAWAELIVKLARWGSRKPTHIVFTEDESGKSCNAMLNINEFSLEEDLSYLAQLETVKYGTADYLPLSVIKTDLKDLQDGSGFCDALGIDYDNVTSEGILGLRCRQDFITAKGNKGRNVYFDLFTIIDLYRNGKGSIFGIDYIDGKFTVDSAVESGIKNSMTLSSIITILSKPDNFMEKIFINEYFVRELSDSKNFTVKDVLHYSLYNMFNKLIYSADITGEFCGANKSDDPRKWAIASMAKCILTYSFLPVEQKNTLENALNNMNALYNGFEKVDLTNLSSNNNIGTISKTSMFTQVIKKEYTATRRLDVGVGCDYYLIAGCEDAPEGFKHILTRMSDSVSVVNSAEVPTLTGVKAIANLGALVYENTKGVIRNSVYIEPSLLKEIKEIYLSVKGKDIIEDYIKLVQASKKAGQ